MAFLVRRWLEHREKMGLRFSCFFPRGAITLYILTICLPGTAVYCLWWSRRVGWRYFNNTNLGAWEKAGISSVLHGLGCNPQNCPSWLLPIISLHHLIDHVIHKYHLGKTPARILRSVYWAIIYPFIDPSFHEWKDWKKKERKQIQTY